MTDVVKTTAKWILILSSIFALYTSGFGLFSALTQRSLHWIFMATAVFLIYPFRKKDNLDRSVKVGYLNFIWVALTLVSGIFLLLTWEKNAMRLTEPTVFETLIGIVMIIVVLEASRRTIGPAMSIIAIIALCYACLGPIFPGKLAHKGFDVPDLVSFLYSTTEGIFGLALGVSATYIIIFVLFGSFLSRSGAGNLFIDISLAFTGRSRSGPARTAIFSNALMGIISGSPVANVVTTGSFILPLLKKTGYPVITGAALLAVAAVGSMFTPPVMGAGAFLIADYLSIPYGKVVLAAIIPAVLFYLSLVVYADISASKAGLKGLSQSELPDWKTALRKRGLLLLPIIILVVLIIAGWSPIKSAFWCIILMIGISFLNKEVRMKGKDILDALELGSRGNLSIAAACATAGIIVGVIAATGLGVKFSSILNQLSGSSPVIALVLTMVAALVLGMGLPPTAVYILLAALTIPSLIGMGINAVAAHFFVFYFACVGAITPPVCLAAYSAAALAKTEPFKTGWRSFRMGLIAYIVPYLFVYNPVLLMQESTPVHVLWAFCTAAAGVILLTFGLEGFFRKRLNIPLRIVVTVSAVLLLIPQVITDVAGLILAAVFFLVQFLLRLRTGTGKKAVEESG